MANKFSNASHLCETFYLIDIKHNKTNNCSNKLVFSSYMYSSEECNVWLKKHGFCVNGLKLNFKTPFNYKIMICSKRRRGESKIILKPNLLILGLGSTVYRELCTGMWEKCRNHYRWGERGGIAFNSNIYI